MLRPVRAVLRVYLEILINFEHFASDRVLGRHAQLWEPLAELVALVRVPRAPVLSADIWEVVAEDASLVPELVHSVLVS